MNDFERIEKGVNKTRRLLWLFIIISIILKIIS